MRDEAVDKTSPMFEELRRIIGANLANMAYEPWQQRRRTVQPVFTKQRVREFGGHMADVAQSVCERWTAGETIDVAAQSRALTLGALGRSVLGIDLDDHEDTVVETLRLAMTYALRRALRPVRAPSWLPTPARHRARRASATVHQITREIVQACRADPNREAPLVHALIAAIDPKTGQPLTDAEICDALIIFLFAGHDTTATTLTYALWSLGHHPQLQDRVAAEVAALADRRLTPGDVAALPCTVQVLRESLRLCPPGPTGTRLARRDVQVGGYRVPAGTMLVIGRWAVHRDPTLWQDPLTFDPDRFNPHNHKTIDRWQYLPFGGGPRSCIGNHFAMLEATLALATIIRHVELHSMDEDFPLTLNFTMVAGAPIRTRVTERR